MKRKKKSLIAQVNDESVKQVRKQFEFRELVVCKIRCMNCGKKYEEELPKGSSHGLCHQCRRLRSVPEYSIGYVDKGKK